MERKTESEKFLCSKAQDCKMPRSQQLGSKPVKSPEKEPFKTDVHKADSLGKAIWWDV